MRNAKCVTIVVPHIEERPQYKQCIESIFSQTYQDIELIQIDTVQSVGKNFNEGLRRAKGEFFKLVGDDDWLPEDSIQNLVDGMKSHSWIVANSINVSDVMQPEIMQPDKLNLKDMIELNRIHNGGTMYRTDVLRKIGGMDESLWTGEEYELHLRLMKNGYIPAHVDKFVYFYRIWRNSKSVKYRRENRKRRAAEIERIQNMYR